MWQLRAGAIGSGEAAPGLQVDSATEVGVTLSVHRLLERLRFRCEARLFEADWFKGEWCTLRAYAILRREWETSTAAE